MSFEGARGLDPAALQVEGELGRGRHAVVFRARDPRGESVALKVLQSADGQALERFRREAELQAHLSGTPGLLPVLGYGMRAGRPALVLPLLERGTLRDTLRARGSLSAEEALDLGDRLCAALEPVHAAGIVHRDLKPENVLLDDAGHPVVADLGLARCLEAGGLTNTGVALGTAGYAPPEQLHDAAHVTAAADVFALGAILYESLSGEPVFPSGVLAALSAMAMQDRVPGVATRCPHLDPRLAQAIDAALDFDPSRRPPDAKALRAALRGEANQPPPQVASRRVFPVLLLALVPLGAALAGLIWLRGGSAQAPSASEARPSTPPRLARLKNKAEGGDPAAMFAYALELKDGIGGLGVDVAFQRSLEAEQWLERAAEGGHGPAALRLGVLRMERKDSSAVSWLRRAADLGEVAALQVLGNCHREGWAVRQDDERAKELYQEAAAGGDTTAMINLHIIALEDGNPVSARMWARRALEAGDLGGCAPLAKLLQRAQEPGPWLESLRVLRQGAAAGVLASELELGRTLLHGGPGVPSDRQAALPWLKRAKAHAQRANDGAQAGRACMFLADAAMIDPNDRDLQQGKALLEAALGHPVAPDVRAAIQKRLVHVERGLRNAKRDQ